MTGSEFREKEKTGPQPDATHQTGSDIRINKSIAGNYIHMSIQNPGGGFSLIQGCPVCLARATNTAKRTEKPSEKERGGKTKK